LLPAAATRAVPAAAAGAFDPRSAHNLLRNGTFDGGLSLPWSASFSAPAEGDSNVVDGALCLDVRKPGKNRWDAQLRHRQLVIQRGHHYRVRFTAWSDRPMRVRPKLGMAGPPYAEYWADSIALGPAPQVFSAELSMLRADDPTAELAFHVGGELAPGAAPYRICIDDLALLDDAFTRAAAARDAPIPNVLVNQLGYLPTMAKLAIVKSAAAVPLDWQLLDAKDEVVASGQTAPHGADAASGESVHVLDFSSFTTPGDGYRLRVGADQSHLFAIRSDLYARLRYDALAFFYQQRSGVEIRLPFAREARWARPAGHLGDAAVPCAPGSGCSYRLNVVGGWYDAGDHGKYVVTGALTAFTLLDQYERAVALAKGLAALGDRSMSIPEAGNRVPDLLDEARFELEFLLRMQVPEGQPLAGMVHHKVHDRTWTELGTAPHEDRVQRYLYPPSTAATLDLAAVAAQASRVFRSVDAAFSARCLRAAVRAWQAAIAHPKQLAPDKSDGGGAYDDRELGDERYWAAAELLVTTGEQGYRSAVLGSPHWARVATTLAKSAADAGQNGALTWQDVATAGTISLALVPSAFTEQERAHARGALVAAADELLALRGHEGYRLPFAAGPGLSYPWGSTSFVLDNAIVLALAYDFTQKPDYRDAVVSAMDYVLGRNPLDQSYVTGYGARPLLHPHHRFWSSQAVPGRPDPPPGLLSGGPNSGVQDPYARGAGLRGRSPQKCFVDHIESFSTNEVAINWNAPLAWVAAFLDSEARP
jgi:endoglucanase